MVNCGLPATSRETWRQVARATAAHSTVMFNDTSSCRFLEGGSFKRLLGAPIVGGPTDVQVAREERADAVMLRASHDGYADRFGVMHQRALKLAPTADRSTARTCSCPPTATCMPRGRAATSSRCASTCIPSVKANRLTDGHGAMLMLPNREVWTFNAYEDRVELEESVYLSGADGPRRTVQIVIYGQRPQGAARALELSRHAATGAGAARAARKPREEPRTAAVTPWRLRR